MHLDSDRLQYSATDLSEINYVVTLEREEDNLQFICPSSTQEHEDYIVDTDYWHIMLTDKSTARPTGFVLLAGLNSPHRSIEFRRVVISEKGAGFGREVIRAIARHCFTHLECNRLWLDVFDFNKRAIALYESEGFKSEGILREAVLKEGTYCNLKVYSILKNEYLIR